MFRVESWGSHGCYQRGGDSGPHDVSLWFYTEQVNDLYGICSPPGFTPSLRTALLKLSPPGLETIVLQ
jgi:hypothetical protein